MVGVNKQGTVKMTREFIMTPVYDKLWYRQGLTDDDLRDLQIVLMTNPDSGDIIKGTGGARKSRFALLDAGKSGGIRVIYLDITHKQQTFLLLCYHKSQQDELTQEQKKQVKALVDTLKGV